MECWVDTRSDSILWKVTESKRKRPRVLSEWECTAVLLLICSFFRKYSWLFWCRGPNLFLTCSCLLAIVILIKPTLLRRSWHILYLLVDKKQRIWLGALAGEVGLLIWDFCLLRRNLLDMPAMWPLSLIFLSFIPIYTLLLLFKLLLGSGCVRRYHFFNWVLISNDKSLTEWILPDKPPLFRPMDLRIFSDLFIASKGAFLLVVSEIAIASEGTRPPT